MNWMAPDRQNTQLPGSTSITLQARTSRYHLADACRSCTARTGFATTICMDSSFVHRRLAPPWSSTRRAGVGTGDRDVRTFGDASSSGPGSGARFEDPFETAEIFVIGPTHRPRHNRRRNIRETGGLTSVSKRHSGTARWRVFPAVDRLHLKWTLGRAHDHPLIGNKVRDLICVGKTAP